MREKMIRAYNEVKHPLKNPRLVDIWERLLRNEKVTGFSDERIKLKDEFSKMVPQVFHLYSRDIVSGLV